MQQASRHQLSFDDRKFLQDFEACRIPPSEFHHREHVRLAYTYLAQSSASEAHVKLRSALQAFIQHNGVDPSKYHETITRAWILAVGHFMRRSGSTESSEEFIRLNPKLLRSEIILTHYSKELLFSDEARKSFVEPDLEPIPRHS